MREFELPDITTLTPDQKNDLIYLLFEQARILTARVSELEAWLPKDSHNSSKPPFSNGLKKTRSLRHPSGAKSGGQVRHKGTTLKNRVWEPDEVIEHALPARCDGCGETLPLSCAHLSERTIQMPKVKQKISGCFRSINRADNFRIIRSCLYTMHKQSHNTSELLRHAFIDNSLQPTSC